MFEVTELEQLSFHIPKQLDIADKAGESPLWIAKKYSAEPSKVFPMINEIVLAIDNRFNEQVYYERISVALYK